MCELGIHIAVTIVLANLRHADLIKNSTKCGAVSNTALETWAWGKASEFAFRAASILMLQGFEEPRIRVLETLHLPRILRKLPDLPPSSIT